MPKSGYTSGAWQNTFLGGIAASKAMCAAAERWRHGTMTGDAAALDTLLTPDYTYTHASNARVDARGTWLESFRTCGRRYQVYALFDETHQVFENVVVMSGRAHQEMNPDGEQRELNTRFLSVWVRDGDVWRCAAWQATRLGE